MEYRCTLCGGELDSGFNCKKCGSKVYTSLPSTDWTIDATCIICDRAYIVQDKDGQRIYQNNDLGMCSKCFDKLKKLIGEVHNG